MRILVPIDFSSASVNALRWSINYLNEIGHGNLDLIHCVHGYRGGTFYMDIDDVLYEKAQDSMSDLVNSIELDNESIIIRSSIAKEEPKPYLIDYTKKNNVDLIILGSRGLTNLKDITIGSVTEYLARNANTPIIAVPDGYNYRGIDKVVFAIGRDEYENLDQLNQFSIFFRKLNPKVHMVQVVKDHDDVMIIDKNIESALSHFDQVFKAVEFDDNVSESISEYAEDVKADLMCFVHVHRNWFEELFHHSITKEELFDLEIPILILHA